MVVSAFAEALADLERRSAVESRGYTLVMGEPRSRPRENRPVVALGYCRPNQGIFLLLMLLRSLDHHRDLVNNLSFRSVLLEHYRGRHLVVHRHADDRSSATLEKTLCVERVFVFADLSRPKLQP